MPRKTNTPSLRVVTKLSKKEDEKLYIIARSQ